MIHEEFATIYFYLHPKMTQNLSHQSVRVLQIVQKVDYVTIGVIAKQLEISHNTASEHVKRLCEQGFLKKSKSQFDQRQMLVTLTSSGVAIVKEHTELNKEKVDQVLKALTINEREMLLKSFSLMSEVAKSVFSD